jgi:hypothetical protein
MVMHEDEHAIVKVILSRALGDDDCFATIVSRDRSESGRAEDRLVLGRFLERMERQFALRAEVRSEIHGRRVTLADASQGHPDARRPPRRRMGSRG